jgi:hypothetical protein
MEAGAWKGEVVHPGAPESQCVYKIRQFTGSFSAVTLRTG